MQAVLPPAISHSAWHSAVCILSAIIHPMVTALHRVMQKSNDFLVYVQNFPVLVLKMGNEMQEYADPRDEVPCRSTSV